MTLVIGKIFRTKNVWVQSIADVTELSSSGKKARRFSDLYLSPWENLAGHRGLEYKGSVI
jgi:hypothetical protein